MVEIQIAREDQVEAISLIEAAVEQENVNIQVELGKLDEVLKTRTMAAVQNHRAILARRLCDMDV